MSELTEQGQIVYNVAKLHEESASLKAERDHFERQHHEWQRVMTALVPGWDNSIPALPRAIFEAISERIKKTEKERDEARREALELACKAECGPCDEGLPVEWQDRLGRWIHRDCGCTFKCGFSDGRIAFAQRWPETFKQRLI